MDLKSSVYWQVFGDVWQYFKQFYPPKSDDKYWDAAVAEIENLMTKYQGSEGEKLMQGLILSVLTEMERIQKMKEKEQMKNEQTTAQNS